VRPSVNPRHSWNGIFDVTSILFWHEYYNSENFSSKKLAILKNDDIGHLSRSVYLTTDGRRKRNMVQPPTAFCRRYKAIFAGPINSQSIKVLPFTNGSIGDAKSAIFILFSLNVISIGFMRSSDL
jgi:hypothetical protein